MTAKSFHALIERLGKRAGMPFPIHPHMLRHACGFALANAGHDTRALQAWLRPSQHPAYGALHGAGAGAVQRILERLAGLFN
jgi:integrase